MATNAYTNPPTWYGNGKNKNDFKYVLRKNGWVAVYSNGREEIVVAMKNVPEEYLTENATKVEKAPEVKPEPVTELKEETPEVKEDEAPVAEEAPKKKSRKKATTEE